MSPLGLGPDFTNFNATSALPARAESGADRHKLNGKGMRQMSTLVTTEFFAQPGRGDDVANL